MEQKQRVIDAGLFLIHPSPSNPKQDAALYARITSITLYSAPRPSKQRVAVYRVTCWRKSPVEHLEGNEGWYYVGGSNGSDTSFSIKLENRPYSIEELESKCIYHFLTQVVSGEDTVPKISLIDRLYRTQSEGRHWEVYVEGSKKAYCDVVALRHTSYYEAVDGKPLVHDKDEVLYRVDGKEMQTIDAVPFKHGDKTWDTLTFEMIVEPESFSHRVSKKNVSN